MHAVFRQGAFLNLLLALGVGTAACVLTDSADAPISFPTPASPGNPDNSPNSCSTSVDCQPGHRCVDSFCLQSCAEGDTCPDGEPCRYGLCGLDENCDGEVCQPGALCRPGNRWCGDAGPMLCTSQGIPLPSQPCEPGAVCFEGECVPVACDERNPAVCDGDNIVVCSSAENRVEAVIPCGSDDFQCRGGACVPRFCQPAERRCANRSVFECADDGSTWGSVEDCGPLEICEVDVCLSASSCTPGERRCDGETIVACNDSRVGYHLVEECDGGYCENGACHAAICPPRDTWCEGNTAHACDTRGRVHSHHHCGPDALCQDGECQPRLCTPGLTRCDSRLRLRCNELGTGWALDSCASGDVCLGGDCLPEGTMLEDGLACDFDEDCLSGECLRGPAFPRGYCSSDNCVSSADCVGGGVCFLTTAIPYCARECEVDGDCRSGYGCFSSEGASICRALVDPGPFGADFPFHTDCDSQLLQAAYFSNGDGLRQFSFMTTSGQTGVFVGLYHLNGHAVRPWTLVGPGSATLPLAVTNPIYESNTDLVGDVVGVLLPSSPNHASYVQPGAAHRLTLASPDDLVCAYLLPTQPDGTRLDINLIGVGVEDFEDGLAEGSPLAVMVARLEQLYTNNGFTIDRIRLSQAASDVAETYQILRGHDALQALLATSETPGPSLDERLSVNVFVVRDMLFAGGSAVGASGGMPGMAGLHGFPSTGIVVSAANLESDPEGVAQVAAHELGHFLGLAHTTEVSGTSIEPIDDTAQCGYLITLAPEFCPDANNLMFPYARDNARSLSNGQRWVLRMSPLTKR